MTVHTYGSIDFNQPNTGSPFPTLNGDLTVLARLAAAFAPHETAPPSMAVSIDAGALLVAGAPLEVKAQTSGAIAPPTANPRIDRVTISPTTGLLTVTTGTEAANPVPPALPAGQLPVAQLRLDPGMTAITNARIRDERVPVATGGGGGLLAVQRFTANATYTATPGTSRVLIRAVGGGGAGGSCTATSSSQVSCASGGSAGAYAETLITSGFDGAAVVVGAGGVPAAIGNNSGGAGGASSFGSILAVPGGSGGFGSIASTAPLLFGGTGTSALPTGANLVAAAGATGSEGFALATTIVVGGIGGSSAFGGGGRGGGATAGSAGQAPGAGGGGAAAIASQSGFQGGAGAAGLVLVYEYA